MDSSNEKPLRRAESIATSAGLGVTYAFKLDGLLAHSGGVQYFVDASSLDSYDLIARSAMVRVLLARRPQLVSMLVLNWRGGVSSVANAIMASLDGLMKTTTGDSDFNAALEKAAPGALRQIRALTMENSKQVRLG